MNNRIHALNIVVISEMKLHVTLRHVCLLLLPPFYPCNWEAAHAYGDVAAKV